MQACRKDTINARVVGVHDRLNSLCRVVQQFTEPSEFALDVGFEEINSLLHADLLQCRPRIACGLRNRRQSLPVSSNDLVVGQLGNDQSRSHAPKVSQQFGELVAPKKISPATEENVSDHVKTHFLEPANIP